MYIKLLRPYVCILHTQINFALIFLPIESIWRGITELVIWYATMYCGIGKLTYK